MNVAQIAAAVIVSPYVNAAAPTPSSRKCSATSLVGNGMNAMHARNAMVPKSRVRSTRSTTAMHAWWLTHQVPIMRNEKGGSVGGVLGP